LSEYTIGKLNELYSIIKTDSSYVTLALADKVAELASIILINKNLAYEISQILSSNHLINSAVFDIANLAMELKIAG
jgi:hypothetical protein